MKCPHCKAWSSILETRGARRRRLCANGHRFTTDEVVRTEMSDRDKQIVQRVLSGGGTITRVAREFGLKSHSQVSRIMKRYAPWFDLRSAGQTVRHDKRRAHA